MVPPPTREPELGRIREDFNNRDLIASETGGVVVDVNRGIATLAAERFPDFDSNGAVNAYDQPTYQNGLIEAEAIIVHEGATLEASDSVELRAEDRVIIAGTLDVGRGGVTIIARERIQIDGTITSEGPVRLLLADDTGTIEIGGRIAARSTVLGTSDVRIYGRGSIQIAGEISTIGVIGALGGNIDVYSYGDLVISGETAHLFTTSEPQGIAGGITLQSESNVTVERGAWLGGMPTDNIVPDTLEPGGDIELIGTNLTLGDDVRIAATGTALREGGRVLLTATGRMFTGHRTLLAAGYGPSGGSVVLRAASIELGEATRVAAGGGSAEPGRVEMHAVDNLALSPFARIEGGAGQCARGGDISLEVGGPLSAGEGAQIIGGAGNTNATCGRTHPGGAIIIFARDAIGLTAALIPGTGAQPGSVDVNIVPDYLVPPANLQVGGGGYLESVTIDRGDDAIDRIPRLVEVIADTPADTQVSIQLAGADQADGPFEDWLPITSDANDKKLESFVGRRWVRYRVVLEGRKFDVPVLDYFEIDLAPAGY